MRTALLLAALGLAGSAMAQMPLPPFQNTFTATLTRGFWFQAPIGFLITGLAVPNESAQPFQVVEVIDLGAAPPPAFPGTVVGTQLFYSNNTPGGSTIPAAIPITAGNYIGILGACNPTQGSATSHNSYGPNGPFVSDILGIPTTITRFGTQFGIAATGGNNPCWQEAAFNVSRVEVFVAPLGGGTLATNTTLGVGCVRSFASVYENFAAAASFDLSNSGLSFLPSGGSYVVLPAVSAYVPPPAAATLVAVGDDVEQTVALAGAFAYPGGSTGSLTVCSNGYVSVASGNGTGFTPAVATMLAFPQTAWGDWHDYFPTGGASGNVKFHEVGTQSIFTWDAVHDFASATPNTWQMQFDRSNSIVTIVFQTMSLMGNGHLTFYSPGGPNLDPGSTDLSVVLPGGGVTLGATDILPLALAGTTRPITGTTWNLNVTNVPATGVIGVDIFGLADPGINDLGFLGMPSCPLRSTLDLLSGWPVGGASHAYGLPIPANPALIAIDLFTTSAVFQVPPVNAFGAITSNGVQGHIGDI